MSPDKLVMMANQIASFFETQPHEDAAAGVADHINQFWEPRMRSELLALMDDSRNTYGLHESVLKAGPLIRKPAPVVDA